MVSGLIRSLLDEPAVADPPVRVWRDWVVAGAIVVGSGIEALLRTDVPWPAPTMLLALLVAGSVFWRRTHRLASMVVTFTVLNVVSVVVAIVDGRQPGFYSMAMVLVVPYALFRWGSGREMAVAVPVIASAWVVGVTTDPGTIGDAIGGLLVLVVTVGLGWEVRQIRQRRKRSIEEVRTVERERIARELHDTVAHHVSAIAIQAQAGQAVAPTQPGAATETLAIIEAAASRTLAEMRTMVRALRSDGDAAEFAPQPGVVDIARLAVPPHSGPPIAVLLEGDLDDLRPSIDAAVYRLAQESITNANRHAAGATSVHVSVHGGVDVVRLTVVDDGRTDVRHDEVTGYGLIGMQERARLLGGALSAGPVPAGGWRVDAVLPRNGATP